MARRHDELERVVDSLRAAGGDAELYAADVTSTVDDQQIVKTAMERFGRLDHAVIKPERVLLVNFAMKLEDSDRTMNTNVRSVILAMQAEIPAMLKSGAARSSNTASVGGIMSVPLLLAYVAS